MKVKLYTEADKVTWDEYVLNHPDSTLYHLSGWGNVISQAYCHKTYYLMAEDSSKGKSNTTQNSKFKTQNHSTSVAGVLPLVHLKHFFFGNSLISIPFFDLGGVLADNKEAEKALINEAVKLGNNFKVDNIELRHQKPINCLNTDSLPSALCSLRCATKSHKVRMLLELPESSDMLMKSFKSKLRSQIKKPIKEGLKAKMGGIELLDEFYEIFLVNMRDLGSPVHSKKLLYNVLNEFSDSAKIFIVEKDNKPLAGSIAVGFKSVLENPWSSSLREYSRLSPNMLIYWSMLEYASDNNFSYFDFGRSSPDEGTYKFKVQWGSQPEPLNWQFIFYNNKSEIDISDNSKMQKAVQYWQKLPVSMTRIIGPMIRKHIGL